MLQPRKEIDMMRLERLLGLMRQAVSTGEFTFHAGLKSKFYIDGRKVTLSPEGAFLVASIIFDLVSDLEVQAIGGPTLGADPIVSAVVLRSYTYGARISGFLVRREQKEYGTERLIEGPVLPGSRVAVVDDVVTTGSSLFHAIRAVEEMGCKVVKVLTILDWQQGGSRKLLSTGYDFTSLLEGNLGTGELSLWTPDQVRQV